MGRDIKSINLYFLKKKYRQKKQALLGYKILFKLITNNRNTKLKTLLRNHKVSGIHGKEIELRDNIDKLLFFYSLLEVAAIADYINLESDSRLVKEIKMILGNKYLRKYYEEFYPLLLPQLLLRRVNGNWIEKVADENAENIFVEFTHLNSTIEKNERVELFLNFIDDIRFNGEGITDLNKILFSPELLREHIQITPQKQSYKDKALLGFFIYLDFIKRFDSLLTRAKDYKSVQSAMWHFHSYWFEHIRTRMSNKIWQSLDNFKRLNKAFSKKNYQEYINQIKEREDSEYHFQKKITANDIPAQNELVKMANESIIETQKALKRIVSNKYRGHLEKIVTKSYRIKRLAELKNIPF
ncbi:MAG: hypothetical protein U0X76_11730 [Bacteroidia bacterium]